jgi:hypothetical protein
LPASNPLALLAASPLLGNDVADEACGREQVRCRSALPAVPGQQVSSPELTAAVQLQPIRTLRG